LEWHTYVVNGLAGENFDESGLRGGRQKGSKADAEDLAFVQRLDWSLSPGLVLGTSFYVGNSAGSNEDLGGSLGTQIFEVHGTWEEGPWSLQALATQAEVDGAQEFNQSSKGDPNLANTLRGAYLQVGYNLLANTSSSMALSPYVRYETLDTQADLPSNAVANPKSDEEILTFGIALKPTDGVVIKLDYASSDQNGDRMALLIGYSF
jgi:hypothetical protein